MAFEAGEAVTFTWNEKECDGKVINERLEEASLVGILVEQPTRETFWIANDVVKKRPLPLPLPTQQDETQKQKQEEGQEKQDTQEKEPTQRSEQQPPLKKLKVHHAAPWLTLCMEYLDFENPATTWVERYVMERSWKLHLRETDEHLIYGAQSDALLVRHIKAHLLQVSQHFGDAFCKWIKGSGILTGSTLLAYIHGCNPFGDWRAGDIDVFTFDTFESLQYHLFPVLGLAKTPGPRLFNTRFGPLKQFQGQGITSMHQSYSKHVEQNLISMKIRVTNRDTEILGHSQSIQSMERVLNVISVHDELKSPNRLEEEIKKPLEINRLEETKRREEINSREEIKRHVKVSEKTDDYDPTVFKMRFSKETVHDYICRVFDMDILCNSFDGEALRFGNDSLAYKDKLATLGATYQRHPIDSVPRLLKRLHKYYKRGITLTNRTEVVQFIGNQLLEKIQIGSGKEDQQVPIVLYPNELTRDDCEYWGHWFNKRI